MAPGDGVSLPTTLAQMGSVAKTQAKGQPGATRTAPVPERMQQDDNLKVNRVKETEQDTENRIDPRQENPDKRKRRRLRRHRKLLARDENGERDADAPGPDDDPDAEHLGRLIDMRA